MIVLFAACTQPTTRVLATPLPGEPEGLALAPTGDLLVSTSSAGNRTLASMNRSTGDERWTIAVGPGAPMVSDNRIYTFLRDGFAAYEPEGPLLWETGLLGLVDDSGPAGLTPGGDVVFATHDGASGTVHAYSRLGVNLWTLPVSGVPTGPLRIGRDATVYVWTTAGQTLAIRDGFLRWAAPSSGPPLAVLPQGVLVRDEGLALLDDTGTSLWQSTAGREGLPTLDANGDIWINSATQVEILHPDSGAIQRQIPRVCGPMTLGMDGQMWTICEEGTLTALGVGATAVSSPIGANAISAVPPILDGGTAFAVTTDGNVSFLNSFTGAALPGSSPWPRATADAGNTGRLTNL